MQHAQQPLPVNGSSVNGYGSGSASGSSAPVQSSRRPMTVTQSSQLLYTLLHDLTAEPIDPMAETFIKVRSNAYKVDLLKDPQKQGGSSSHTGGPLSSSTQNGTIDPLAKHMEDLKSAISSSGSVRRKSGIWRQCKGFLGYVAQYLDHNSQCTQPMYISKGCRSSDK